MIGREAALRIDPSWDEYAARVGAARTEREAQLRRNVEGLLNRIVSVDGYTIDMRQDLTSIADLYALHAWLRADVRAGEVRRWYYSRRHSALWHLLSYLHPIPDTGKWNPVRLAATHALEDSGLWERIGHHRTAQQWWVGKPTQRTAATAR